MNIAERIAEGALMALVCVLLVLFFYWVACETVGFVDSVISSLPWQQA